MSQKPKKSENFCKKLSKPIIVCTRWKENCTLQKCCWILFPPMKVKSYNQKTPVFAEIYSFG